MTPRSRTPQARLAPAEVPPYRADERINTWPYSSATRAERLIAAGRLILSVFALLTIWLDPREPAKHAHLTYLLLGSYALYCTVLLTVVWTSHAAVRPLRLATHGADLALYMVFIYLTEGTTSPFFAYLVFSILCGAIRWRWRGALATASAAIAGYVALGMYAEYVLKDPAFEVDGFVFRAVYLAVVAGILIYVGVYEEQVRGEIRRLADWPRLVSADNTELIQQLLGHAAHIVAVPRALMVWDEPEEPWRHVALWSANQFTLRREGPDHYSPLVADVLEHVPFLCRNAATDNRALFAAGATLREWRGASLHADLVADFHIESVLAVPLPGERLWGWIFYLDKRRPSHDDVAVGTISAREIIAALDQAELLARQREIAVIDERTRLGRDLHDGLLQSLTAARLQLHQLTRQVSGADAETAQKLQGLETAMSANQRELRMLVDQLRPGKAGSPETRTLIDGIEQLREAMRRDWDLEVITEVSGDVLLPPETSRDVFLMVHEALVNAARHGHATKVHLRVRDDNHSLKVSVRDNGGGFAFTGRRDHVQLAAEHIGPTSLRERLASLNGTLVVESSSRGACVEITIPSAERD